MSSRGRRGARGGGGGGGGNGNGRGCGGVRSGGAFNRGGGRVGRGGGRGPAEKYGPPLQRRDHPQPTPSANSLLVAAPFAPPAVPPEVQLLLSQAIQHWPSWSASFIQLNDYKKGTIFASSPMSKSNWNLEPLL